MAFLKNRSFGRKQTAMPGPTSAAYKKIVAARKAAAKARAKSNRRTKKAARTAAAFSSLRSRQALVERIKRQIWASVLKINDAIISLAMAGNFQAAKALFDFAGVYSLPPEDNENARAAAVPEMAPDPEAQAEAPKRNPVSGLLRSIGMEPDVEPEAAS
jgi:hypothetical protein